MQQAATQLISQPGGAEGPPGQPVATLGNTPSGLRQQLMLIAFAIVYFALIVGPVLGVLYFQTRAGHAGNFLVSLADNFAISGFMIIVLQFVLASRTRWMESPFGMDIILRLHRVMGTLAAVLLLLHPVLLAWGRGNWGLLYKPLVPWPLEVGRLALILLLATAIMALFRVSLRMEYQRWRSSHRILALSVIVLAFVHSLIMGVGSAARPGDLWPLPLRIIWYAALPVALLAFLHRTGSVLPWLGNRNYRVQAVEAEAPGVFTVRLEPAHPGHALRHFVPGQFHFLTLQPAGREAEEHPFTISSAPDRDGVVASTIKASGDFTKEIGALKPGTAASIRGPFGRFSCLLHPEQKNLVFIAGGVGITPFMSMLRHMQRQDGGLKQRSVLLIYANRQARDILFRKELDALAATGNVRVAYVLSRPDDQWRQERGHVNADLLRRVTAGLADPAFYICGPPAMMASAATALREMGVPPARIFLEEFAF